MKHNLALFVGLLGISLLSSQAWAGDAEDVTAAIQQFYRQLSDDDVEQAMSHIKLGAHGFLPKGLAVEIPNEQVRAALVEAAVKDREENGATFNKQPKHIEVKSHGDVATATFLLDGTETPPFGDQPQHSVNRVSMVWRSPQTAGSSFTGTFPNSEAMTSSMLAGVRES